MASGTASEGRAPRRGDVLAIGSARGDSLDTRAA